MAKESTFPTDDVPDRSEEVLAVLQQHEPVPVPMTTLYLMVEDKRALADEFQRLEADGRIERAVVHPEDTDYARVEALTRSGGKSPTGPIGVYRLRR